MHLMHIYNIYFLKLNFSGNSCCKELRKIDLAFVKWDKEVDMHDLLVIPALEIEKVCRKATANSPVFWERKLA